VLGGARFLAQTAGVPAELIGRERELEELAALLARGAWVTLLGLPGVGKSALAQAAVAGNGVLGDTLLGDTLLGDTDADLEALRAAHQAGRAVVAVATAPLGVPDEHVLRLAPLPVPSRTADVDAILASPAVRALVAAARRAGVPFGALEPIAGSLAEVARRTSGLPLAIELCAASLPIVTLDELARMLRRPSTLASTPGPHRPARHASLRAAFGPVLEALSPEARALLLRAAPHGAGLAIDPAVALAPLRELIDRGLLERAPDAGPPRYRALELVGALVLELAPPDDAEAARVAHAEDVAARLRTAAAAVWQRASREAAEQIAALGPDVERMLEHAEAGGDATLAVDAALRHANGRGGCTPELLARLEALAPAPSEPAVLLAIEQATLAWRAGRREDARPKLERAAVLAASLDEAARAEVALARGLWFREVERDYRAAHDAFDEAARASDPMLRIRAHLAAAGTGIWAEEYGDAVRAAEEARALLHGLDAPRLRAVAGTNLAIAWIGHWPGPHVHPPRTQRLDEAREAAATFEAIGEVRSAAVALQAAAVTLSTLLRFDETRELLRAVGERFRQVGDRRYALVADVNLGDTTLGLGRLDEAEPELAHALASANVLGDRLLAALARASEGDLAWERGELVRARDALGQARSMLEEDGEHASRLALVLAQEAVLSPPERAAPLIERASALAGDETNVHRHCVRVYGALLARRRGDDTGVEAVLPWLRAWVTLARSPAERRGADGSGIPYAVWLAVRRYVRELDDAARGALLERAYGLDAPPGPALLVDLDRRRVRAPSGAWIDLSRREKPFALLAALADASPRTLGVSALVERVWAGEKVLPDAGANRVYVAMATLRKQRGLEAVIASDGDGYRIAPELDVLVFREAAP
jgi:tetratricopeptide (TPR) repeat protein